MSGNPFPLVAPIVDYDPPAFGGPPDPPSVTTAVARLRPGSAARPDPVTVECRAATQAAAFADAALRRILEVIDRRRPLAQLRPLLAGGLADSLLSGTARRGQERNFPEAPACLRRVRAQPIGSDGQAAEVSAHYTRGGRVHAIACRVEQVSTATGPRWQVVALHLG